MNTTNTIEIQETATIQAPADVVYAIIADYKQGHLEILPKKYFTHLDVLAGGYGEGTKLGVGIKLWGKKMDYFADISEPVPGKEIMETDTSSGLETRFILEAGKTKDQTSVTIRTKWEESPGIKGKIERWTAPSMLKKIYREELANLNSVATKKAMLN